jgi:hypothetical protein
LTFVGATCVEFALAFAACSVGALCRVDCDWPPADCGALPCWVWALCWVVLLVLAAVLEAAA